MKLKNLLTKTRVLTARGIGEMEVKSLSVDSRKVSAGTLFFAVHGEKEDGTRFIADAFNRGALGVVSQKEIPQQVAERFESAAEQHAVVLVSSVREAVADLATAFYGDPSLDMKVLGVTGTNGKTTTTFLLKHLCDEALWRCGLVGTVRYEIGEEIIPADRTTPDALELQSMLARMRDAGCKSVSMEVSSHAVSQQRVRGVNFDSVVFTNLTQDHLDYHKTMEAYFEAKASLLLGLGEQRFKKGTAVVNCDDSYGEQLIRRLHQSSIPTLTFGMGIRADFRASALRTDSQGTVFQLDALGKSWLVRTPLIGRFNVMNTLGAIAAAHAVGIPVRDSVLAMASAPSVPGRMQPVPGKRSFRVFVDYAHTEDALRNALKTLRDLQPRRLIVVFGCGGDRDRGKRPRMGQVAQELADWSVVTSDNPRSESAEEIVSEIVSGMRGVNHEVVLDRAEAIRRAIFLAQPQDVVLIAGKGHEGTQIVGDTVVPFDDLSVAKAAVENRHLDTGY
jgi:UDP-N-acetylmuramoyl-L-alanyl-D-glutamate--2,6-diaminopimelate ligase